MLGRSLLILMMAPCLVALELTVSLHLSQDAEVQSEARYQETISNFELMLIRKAMEVVNAQQLIITAQRRIIERLSSSPCPERALMTFHESPYYKSIPRRKQTDRRREQPVVKAARTALP